jgi:hypothetical protein
MISGQIKQIANRHNLAVARTSSETEPKITEEELRALLKSKNGMYFSAIFSGSREFSVRSFALMSDPLPDVVGAINRSLKLGHGFNVIFSRGSVYVLGAAGSEVENLSSFIAAMNRSPKLVEAFHILLKEPE